MVGAGQVASHLVELDDSYGGGQVGVDAVEKAGQSPGNGDDITGISDVDGSGCVRRGLQRGAGRGAGNPGFGRVIPDVGAVAAYRGVAGRPDNFHRVVRRVAELRTAQRVPADEPLSVTRANAGL